MNKKHKKQNQRRRSAKKGLGKQAGINQAARAPISLCMIVKNEEKHLTDCLESVKGLVSEIVVVDTGSTDATVEIARRYGAKVISYSWNDDFAEARNQGLKAATQPWILYLDADERLYAQYHSIVKSAVISGKADAYYINVYSPVRGVLGNVPHVQAYPRLFRKIPGVQFVGKVHEQITPKLQEKKARFAVLNARIDHLGYALSDEELQRKITRNLRYLEQQVASEPGNAYALFQLGQTNLLAGNREAGLQQLQATLKLPGLSKPLAATTLLIIANEEFKEENYPEAIRYINEATAIAPKQRLGWFLLSECFARQQRWEDALIALEKLNRFKAEVFTDLSLDKVFDDVLIWQRQGLYHFQLGNYHQATYHFQQYFSKAETLRSASLEKYLFALNQLPEVTAIPQILNGLIQKLAHFDDPRQAIQLLAAFCEQREEFLFQERVFRWAVQEFPQEAMYHFYLGVNLLNRGNYLEAEEHLLEALSHSPHTYEIYYNLAVVSIKQQNYDRAIRYFETIREKFPVRRALANRRLAALYVKVGQSERALELLKAEQMLSNG